MAVSFTKVRFPSNNAERRHQRCHLNLYSKRRLFWALELFRVLVHWVDWAYQLHISVFRSKKQTRNETLDNSLSCRLLQWLLCLPCIAQVRSLLGSEGNSPNSRLIFSCTAFSFHVHLLPARSLLKPHSVVFHLSNQLNSDVTISQFTYLQ